LVVGSDRLQYPSHTTIPGDSVTRARRTNLLTLILEFREKHHGNV